MIFGTNPANFYFLYEFCYFKNGELRFLSDSNGIQTHNHLVRKLTLNQFG